MFIERLENRRLMSATVTASLGGDGTLSVNGTSEADTIDVTEVNGVVTVVANGDAEHPIFCGAVSQVKIDGRDGNDQVSYFGNTLRASIYLKNGNDYLQIGVEGTGSAVVFGGNGDDLIFASGNVIVDPGNGTF